MRDFEQCFRNQRIINRPPARRVQGREDREAKIDILELTEKAVLKLSQID